MAQKPEEKQPPFSDAFMTLWEEAKRYSLVIVVEEIPDGDVALVKQCLLTWPDFFGSIRFVSRFALPKENT